MKKAFSQILNKEVSAEEVSKNEFLKVGLKCRDCVISMSHRRAHKWYESVVTACFVRKQEHIESCQYYAVGQMGILARLSDDDVLSRLDKKNFIFRLTMIHDELDGKEEKKIKHNKVLKYLQQTKSMKVKGG
ncbi:hypothetical protein LZP85_02780 [Priestia flexa]|jgi:hypothetical protein|uniref:hypothetical protein n=1 Tax=Priestia flexa TaxID=86664 RepID=UPI001CFE4BC5|nr:hypothetical protein [Priestia flexa]UIR30731.1 hypothetical protein LZP85_02780 [Priestia flexa]